jgi:aryl-alcohol dehydrogenase-like predicted oxidoreductase
MRTVALPGTDLAPSRLAFGSALLMGRLGRRQSVRLLEVAHESGITHFDTARSYGYGEAESAVGAFLARHRGHVTVTTKLGMTAPRGGRALRVAKGVARVATRRAPGLRGLAGSGARQLGQAGRFEPGEARASLETSLRALGTEAVDILLLHECRPADLETDGLVDFLEGAVREGKVRYLGIGTDADSTRAILAQRPELAQVVQVAHNAVDPTLDRLGDLSGRAVVTHSAVRPALERLAEPLHDAARREEWSRALGVDCSSPDALGRLLLAYALQSNPAGVVLFASADEERIRSNAALADSGELSREQVRAFAQLAREAVR